MSQWVIYMKQKSKKMVGITAAMVVIVSLLVVSVPAKELEGAEKIPKEEREWMAREEKKIQEELKDPEFLKKLERSKNRKWYSYEELYGKELDEKDREYMRILKRMEREGIDTNELFDAMDDFLMSQYYEDLEAQRTGTVYQPKELDVVQFSKEFEKRKLEERKGNVHIEKENKANENFNLDIRPLRGDVDTDLIYYSPWDQFVYVTNNDNAKFYLEETEFAGIGVWVHLDHGANDYIDYTWRTYRGRDPEWIKNYVFWHINTFHPENKYHPNGVYLYDVEDVHIKYFIQADTVKDMYHYPSNKWVHLKENGFFKKVELWSEATYYLDSGSWVKYGYPDSVEGGAQIIENNGNAYTSTGNAYYRTPWGSPSYYPDYADRDFGYGSETGYVLHLESHPLHQQAVLS